MGMKFHCCFSFLRKFADIAVSLVRIFDDISLPRKFAFSIFLCPKRSFAQSFEFSPTSAKFRISNERNFQRKFAKFSRNFDENKARISPKFAPITFAQYCKLYVLWPELKPVCSVFLFYFLQGNMSL